MRGEEKGRWVDRGEVKGKGRRGERNEKGEGRRSERKEKGEGRGVGKGEVEKGIRKRRVKREGGREAGKIEWVDGCDGCVVMRKLSRTKPFLHTRPYT